MLMLLLFLQLFGGGVHHAPMIYSKNEILSNKIRTIQSSKDTSGYFKYIWPDSIKKNGSNVESISIDSLGDIYAVCTLDNKIRLSTNKGNSWNVSLNTGWGILRSTVSGNFIIIGGLGIKPTRTFAGTNNWSIADSSFPEPVTIYGFGYNPKTKTTLICSMDSDGIYRSTDFGSNWSISNSGFHIPIMNGFMSPFASSIFIDTLSGSTYLTSGWYWDAFNGHWDGEEGGDGVWKSTDDGLNWHHIGLDSLSLFSVAVWNHTVYSASCGSGLYYLTGDSTWTHIQSPAVGTYAQQNNIWFLYPTKYGLLVGFNNWGIGLYLLQGTPKAPKWTYLGLSGLQLQSAALDAQGYLYIGEQMGMWKSTLPLKNIVPLNQTKIIAQDPGAIISVPLNVPYNFKILAYDLNNDSFTYVWKINGVIDSSCTTNSLTYTFKKLAANFTVSVVVTNNLGSYDSTSWSFAITGIAELTGLPKEFALSQNFPNPFNPSTLISYSIPKSSLVTLKIYDVLGREIETLVNENKPTGNYSVQFNAAKLTSGVYFYKMQAGDFAQTKKLVLLK